MGRGMLYPAWNARGVDMTAVAGVRISPRPNHGTRLHSAAKLYVHLPFRCWSNRSPGQTSYPGVLAACGLRVERIDPLRFLAGCRTMSCRCRS